VIVTFPLSEKRTVDVLLKHLASYNLTYPGNCAVSAKTLVAYVSSSHPYALATARTAW